MKRLVDEQLDRGSEMAALAHLLDALDASAPTAESRARVRLRMGGGRRPSPRRVPTLAIVMLFAGNALAAAALTGPGVRALRAAAGRMGHAIDEIGRGRGRADETVALVASPSPATQPAALASLAPQASLASEPEDASSGEARSADFLATACGGASPPVAAIARTVHRRASARPGARSAMAVLPPGGADEAAGDALVIAGTRALTVEGDPERAQVLFDDYLQRFPDGPLVEEALVRSIEATRAAGEATGPAGEQTQERVQRYLARFPHGTFRASVERMVNREGAVPARQSF